MKLGFVIVLTFVFGGAVYVGLWCIRGFGETGKALIDLVCVASNVVALAVSTLAMFSILHFVDGRWQMFFDLYAEPKPPFVMLVPIVLALTSGLVLSRRWIDFVAARSKNDAR